MRSFAASSQSGVLLVIDAERGAELRGGASLSSFDQVTITCTPVACDSCSPKMETPPEPSAKDGLTGNEPGMLDHAPQAVGPRKDGRAPSTDRWAGTRRPAVEPALKKVISHLVTNLDAGDAGTDLDHLAGPAEKAGRGCAERVCGSCRGLLRSRKLSEQPGTGAALGAGPARDRPLDVDQGADAGAASSHISFFPPTSLNDDNGRCGRSVNRWASTPQEKPEAVLFSNPFHRPNANTLDYSTTKTSLESSRCRQSSAP